MESFYKLVKIEDVNYADPLGMRAIHYVVRLYPDRLLIDMIRTLKVKRYFPKFNHRIWLSSAHLVAVETHTHTTFVHS